MATGGRVAAQRKELYDEPYIWMDGRRSMALDGVRRTGGGPAGRLDQQAVHEITRVPISRSTTFPLLKALGVASLGAGKRI